MPLLLKKEVSEEEFYDNFCNTKAPHQTLLCFSLKEKDKTLWKLWGHAYNNPGHCHAEILVLKEIESYLMANIPNATKYSITWFISYSPCSLCCNEITNFVMKSKTKIQFSIRASRPYYVNDGQTQEGLKTLKSLGILIEMMEYSDYEECFYLFVDPCIKFSAWPDLEIQSGRNAEIFYYLLYQEDDILDSFTTYDSSPVLTGSTSDFEGHLLTKKIPPEDLHKTPDNKKDELSDKTPQKIYIPQRTREDGKEIRRKLF